MKLKIRLLVALLQFPLFYFAVYGIHFVTGLEVWLSAIIGIALDLMYSLGEGILNRYSLLGLVHRLLDRLPQDDQLEA